MSSTAKEVKYVDAFSHFPFKGNPVAVILDGDGLSGDEMQQIARWTNLSETTFVLPPTDPKADYLLRIFTPGSELPFAGHPTLGSAHAVLEAGKITPRNGKIVQQCKQGLVPITIVSDNTSPKVVLDLPKAKTSDVNFEIIPELESILGNSVDDTVLPAIIDVGPVWLVAKVTDVSTLLRVQPNLSRLSAFERSNGITGVTLFANYAPGGPADIEVRSFAPSCGVQEDPVCGSGNGSVAVYRAMRGLLPSGDSSYVAGQGRKIGRDGRVYVNVEASGAIKVGGHCVTCLDGMLKI
ncbi:hypothetical protein BZL39_O04010 [Zygosaccharomyces parabailii]|uniref:ZYBA0S06-07448g1_1 n=1 Tax=Zygosaccharomyces bailii (strain CLIB 213 / ATCC 58445 / CBS 680 / BCRC 21525 / NBRC 1098 / NCYC 1416 / NRRL Y-2227) TaxID=1333698 RepID=A0A8J2T8M6_ZYGB2|nr:hypothetical protein BZL39_O04010 [Zygosaccharomyces parabailii]CDF90390.1 ZYBA0S06-07448g1_1 [Zygosaccharomyces bailii CLIB 213]CDH16390.1 related to Antisense-enhancing sequence 1 [Zygosaccharomyces bailii ISA1307]